MDEIYRGLIYYEIGKFISENMSIDFSNLAEKRAIEALSEIQKIIKDDKLDEVLAIAYIDEVLIKYGIEASGCYE